MGEIEKFGGKASFVKADVSRGEDCHKVVFLYGRSITVLISHLCTTFHCSLSNMPWRSMASCILCSTMRVLCSGMARASLALVRTFFYFLLL